MEPIFINRELSWLEFNYRVLQEALDKRNPLMERVRFMGIFSNNRDEFFRVRVSTYRRFARLKNKQGFNEIEFRKEFDPERILKEIDATVSRQDKLFNKCFDELSEEMAAQGIFFVNESQLTERQGAFVRAFFRDEVRAFIFPLMLSNIKDLVGKLHDGDINLVVSLNSSANPAHSDTAIVKVPSHRVGRFIKIPSEEAGKRYIMFLDDVIRYCLDDVFSVYGYDVFRAYTIKFIRDAEFDVDNDVLQSYAQLLQKQIQRRKKGNPVRFVYDATIPPCLLTKVMKRLKIGDKDAVYGSERYHNFKDFTEFPKIDNPEFYYKPITPFSHAAFQHHESVFKAIKRGDILLHFPYHSFNCILDLMREAAMDPKVVSVDMTFYRGADNSSIINSLMSAARNGKKVRVYLELLARFDEEANLKWAAQLQEEGVNVIPAVQGYKVHSKMLCIKRKEESGMRYYTNVSTGNFNENTARTYVDESLLTADTEIGKEVVAVFDMLEYRFRIPMLKKLVISPFYTRKFIARKINSEIHAARQGKESWMILKMNALSDKSLIEKLYKASQEGVKITLIVRGICVLRAGVKGLSENIRVLSIVGRYLEHSRVFVFSNQGNPQYYIGSADLMVRNLDNRLETIVPVRCPELCKELWELLQLQINDNTKARNMLSDGLYEYATGASETNINAQEEFYNILRQERTKETI